LALAVATVAIGSGSGYTGSGYSGNWQWLQWQLAVAVATLAVAPVAVATPAVATVVINSGNWQLAVATGSGTHRQIGHGCQVAPNSVPQRHVPHPKLLHKL
jgi:hypothetical protein